MKNKKLVLGILALVIIGVIATGVYKSLGLKKPDCPYECCIDEQYKIKACPTGHICKENKCIITEWIPEDGKPEPPEPPEGEEGDKSKEEGEGKEEGEECLPSSDQASGMEPITRYPGSVMLKYTSPVIDVPDVSFSAGIWYETTDDFNTVLNWYRAQRTWQEASAEGIKDTDLYYITDFEYLQVSLRPNGKCWRTSISILYFTD